MNHRFIPLALLFTLSSCGGIREEDASATLAALPGFDRPGVATDELALLAQDEESLGDLDLPEMSFVVAAGKMSYAVLANEVDTSWITSESWTRRGEGYTEQSVSLDRIPTSFRKLVGQKITTFSDGKRCVATADAPIVLSLPGHAGEQKMLALPIHGCSDVNYATFTDAMPLVARDADALVALRAEEAFKQLPQTIELDPSAQGEVHTKVKIFQDEKGTFVYVTTDNTSCEGYAMGAAFRVTENGGLEKILANESISGDLQYLSVERDGTLQMYFEGWAVRAGRSAPEPQFWYAYEQCDC